MNNLPSYCHKTKGTLELKTEKWDEIAKGNIGSSEQDEEENRKGFSRQNIVREKVGIIL